jgi:hypothetical protein
MMFAKVMKKKDMFIIMIINAKKKKFMFMNHVIKEMKN